MPFLFYGGDHLRSNMRIISSPGSFSVQSGDHLRSGIICGPGIICGAVQADADKFLASPQNTRLSLIKIFGPPMENMRRSSHAIRPVKKYIQQPRYVAEASIYIKAVNTNRR